MSKKITVNLGEKIEVVNTDGEVWGYFYYSPADVDMMRRCEVAGDAINKIVENAQSLDENARPQAINDGIKEQVAYIIGEEAAEIFFKVRTPISVLPDGTLYVFQVLEAIGNFIESTVEPRMKKVDKQLEKYTAKYSK